VGLVEQTAPAQAEALGGAGIAAAQVLALLLRRHLQSAVLVK
jgi:hypothetical protein